MIRHNAQDGIRGIKIVYLTFINIGFNAAGGNILLRTRCRADVFNNSVIVAGADGRLTRGAGSFGIIQIGRTTAAVRSLFGKFFGKAQTGINDVVYNFAAGSGFVQQHKV